MNHSGAVKCRIIVILLAIIAALGIFIYNLITISQNNIEAVAGKYIEALANIDCIKINEMGLPFLGLDTAYYSTSFISSDEAERNGLLKEPLKVIRTDGDISKQILAQFDSVTNSFGKDAWDHVTYKLDKVEHTDGKIVYVEKKTGKQITEEQYEALNQTYWERIAAANGITYEELFRFDDPNLDRESAYRFHSLFLDGLDRIPTDTEVITDYELYRVSLAFNGETVGTDGREDYRFYISNQSGSWEVKEGLTWDEPLGEPSEEEY